MREARRTMQTSGRLRVVAIAVASLTVGTGGVFTAEALAGTSFRSRPATVTTNPGAPSDHTLPTISGTPYVGGTLIASPGTWTGSPAPSFTYQWYLCADVTCNPISG